MVAKHQVLVPFQALQDRLDGRRPEEEIAKDIHRIVVPHLRVPPLHHRLVHLLDGLERTSAEPDDVEVPKVLIGCEISHTRIPLS